MGQLSHFRKNMGLELKEKFYTTKKQRVQGSGPSRKKLPAFHYVGAISKEIHIEILKIAEQFKNENDLYKENYNLSKACDLKIPKKHINFLLQEPIKKSDGMNEKDYKKWKGFLKHSLLKKFLSESFPNLYRTRIAILPPHSGFEWHIDMSTKVSCRFHILVKNSQFSFEINKKDKIYKVPFTEKSLYFTNTAYPHRVQNSTDYERISLLFDIEYENIKSILPIIE